jgi:hypothetical protein
MKRAWVLIPLIFFLASPVVARVKPQAASGFAHARQSPRTPITIQRSEEPRVLAAMDYWNLAARWQLFVVADAPEITMEETDCCWARWGSEPPYESCHIAIGSDQSFGEWQLIAHELGHCLGWGQDADTFGKGVLGGEDLDMVYDRRQLKHAGYMAERICDPECHDE